jgi:hypothetical protein
MKFILLDIVTGRAYTGIKEKNPVDRNIRKRRKKK